MAVQHVEIIRFIVCFFSLLLIAVSEVHSSMGKAVQMYCSGDWDPKRVPEGTECLEPLLAAASSHLPSQPPRSFTGENITEPITSLITHQSFRKVSIVKVDLTRGYLHALRPS